MAKTSTSTDFTPAIRRNWGYWDGKAAREANKFPIWCRAHIHRQAHPFDKAYGEGFWAGWYGEDK